MTQRKQPTRQLNAQDPFVVDPMLIHSVVETLIEWGQRLRERLDSQQHNLTRS